MDSNNWRPVQGCNPPAGYDLYAPYAAHGGDWRADLRHDDRTRIVNNMLENLKGDTVWNPQQLYALEGVAVQFEERIYTQATSQPDYLWKISLKMRSLEPRRQQAPGNLQVMPNQNNPGQG